MKTANPATLALLGGNGSNFVFAELLTITLQGGSVLRYTSADKSITYSATTWDAGPIIKRGRIRQTVGVAVDSLDLTISADSTVTVNGVPLMTFIARGGLDGATVRLERVVAQSWAVAPAGSVIMFTGRVNTVDVDRFQARVAVLSDLELLDVKVPRNVYQPGCLNTLYDDACGVSKAAKTVAGTVTSVTNSTTFLCSALTQSAGYFDLGVVTMTSGPNSGLRRTVRAFASGAVEIVAPWPFAVSAGETFTIYPGCDKTQATCNAKFSNLSRFRGFPYLPVAETVT